MEKGFDVSLGELWKAFSSYSPLQQLVVLVGFFLLFTYFFGRYYLAPGTDRLASKNKDRDDAVGILKSDKEKLEKENSELDHRNRELETVLALWHVIKNDPAMLRARADQVERERAAEAKKP